MKPVVGKKLVGYFVTGQASSLPSRQHRSSVMSHIATKDGTQIFYKDWGKGEVIQHDHR
jgi:hypothetical protein